MEFHTIPLSPSHVEDAVTLDQKWFGEYGINSEDLTKYIESYPKGGLALIVDGSFEGFATFEILEGQSPKDYIGDIPKLSKVLFIQQFTTTTNYSISDMKMDTELFKAVEHIAKQSGCIEIWEALATTHPYSLGVNKEHDAFGFYLSNNFSFDNQNTISWSPDPNVSIPCYLFRKKL